MLIFFQLIVVDGSSETEDTPTKVPGPARPAPKPRTAAKVKIETKIPALSIASDGKIAKTKKARVKTESSPVGFTPDSSSDVKGLPALVGAAWYSRFLPEAYRALYCSMEPITFAAKGETRASELAAVRDVQQILDIVHPGNTLVIGWADKICARVSDLIYIFLSLLTFSPVRQAVSRVRERRTRIAIVAARIVDEFFETDTYRNQPIAIRTYAQYAVRPDGPAFFRVPTPEHILPNPRLDNYIVCLFLYVKLKLIRTFSARNRLYGVRVHHPNGHYVHQRRRIRSPATGARWGGRF